MSAILLSLHVLAAIVLVGPVTVAASLFPRYARACLDPGPAGVRAQGVVLALHRITVAYAVVALAVPAFGLATALTMGILGEAWLLVSIGVTLVAAVLLGLVVVPGQRRVLATVGEVEPLGAPAAVGVVERTRTASTRLAMGTGLFALAWAVVVVLMILRPGSTTRV